MVVTRPSAPLASANICPNFTARMKTVFEKDILPGHYRNKLSLFAVAHNVAAHPSLPALTLTTNLTGGTTR